MTDTNKQSLISAARRRAKAAARADGESHQSHLERIARDAGRDDWGAFLADPVELPKERSAIGATSSTERTHGPQESDVYWAQAVRFRVKHLVPVQVAGVMFVLGVLVLAANQGWMVIVFDSFSGNGIKIMATATTVILGLMFATALLMWMNAGIATFHALRNRPPKGALTRIWKRTIACSIAPPAYLFGIILMPHVVSSIPLDDIMSMREDQAFIYPIRLFAGDRPSPVVVLAKEGETRRIAAIIDQRAVPISLRRTSLSDSPLPEPLRNASVDNPVVRFMGALDCTNGSFGFDAIEVAASVSAPAAVRIPREKKTRILDAVDREALCNARIVTHPASDNDEIHEGP